VQPQLRIAAQKRGNALVVLLGPFSQPPGEGFGKTDGDGNGGFSAVQSCLLFPENAVRCFFGAVSKIIPVKSVESTTFKRSIRRLVRRLFLPYPRKLRFSG